MRSEMFFESYGLNVVAVRFTQVGERVLNFQIVQAIDYPALDQTGTIPEVNHFNIIGADGEVVDNFEQGNLIASGRFVMQWPEDMKNPIAMTIEHQCGVIFTGQEYKDFGHTLFELIQEKAFVYLQGEDLVIVEKKDIDFTNV